MSNTTIATAARQYARRPPDERYESVPALVDTAQTDKRLSAERTYNLKDLHVVPARALDTGATVQTTEPTPDDTLLLASPRGQGRFTHWSFGQLCRTLAAPAAYLRELPPALAAECLNHGLQASAPGTAANLLVRAANGQPEPTIRACTSDTYGRLWDCELYGAIQQTIVDRDSSWSLPPVWGGGTAGAYRGDRDSFLIVTNGGSIVTDPSLSGKDDGTMFRGILVRNSEVGASAVVIETILYRYICGNHLLWGAIVDRQFRRRHIGSHVLRDTIREISRIAWNWQHASPARDQAIIKGLIDHEVAHTREAVIDELRALGATKEQATEAYETCERTEAASPRSFWGVSQGLTRNAQQELYQDDRYTLDRLAALVLARGARELVHAA